ncbi:MAG: zf-HC2 domain-containing protein [Terriglobales bacterium]
MTCSDVRRALPEILEGAPDTAFATEFKIHVKSCPDCSDLVSDLKLITSEARQLATSEEPSPRVWLGIAAQLRAEGLIREAEFAPTSAARRPILLPTPPRRRWSAWWLAPVAAGLVAAGSYVVSHKPAPQVAMQQAPATPGTAPAPTTTSVAEAPAVTPASVPAPAPRQLAQKAAPPKDIAKPAVEPAPSAEDQQFLSVVSTRAPSMRATYENQLNAVNADIRETEAYVKRNPGDADARQHLMDAYQQKALLYQIALDRIQ